MPVFHVRSILEAADLSTPAGRDAALEEGLPVLRGMEPGVSQDELQREIADRVDADPALVAKRLEGEGRSRAPAPAERSSDPAQDGERRPPAREPAQLNVRERREQALLAMCIAAPQLGRDYLERLGDEHLSSPLMGRARDWLAGHLADPVTGLPRDDEELFWIVNKLVATSRHEPATPEAMELNFLELERRAIEDRLATLRESGGESPVELQRERAEVVERIARHRG